MLRSWFFLLACTLLGTLLTGVVLLARPPIYEVQAVVQFDPRRYDFPVVDKGGTLSVHPLLVQEARDLLSLTSPADLRSSPQIGQPIEFSAVNTATLRVIGRATGAARVQQIANDGATSLGQAMQSIYGWNLLRTLLRRTIFLQGQGRPEPPSALTPHLFNLMEAGFLTYDLAIPVSQSPPPLTTQDVADVTLAIDQMHRRQTARINALFGQRDSASDPVARAQIEQEITAVDWKREQLGKALMTLYKQGATLVQGGPGGSPPQVLPGQPASTPGLSRWLYLLVGAGMSLFLAAGLALFNAAFNLSGRLREVLKYRDLIWNLIVRDLKARYKNSVLGYFWSLVNPLLLMTVFTVLFKYLLKSAIPNFAVFIIVALLPWNFCATSVSGAVVSITSQGGLIKKVYFPREVIPIALVLSNLINFLLALPAMLLLMLVLNASLKPVALLFPLIALIQTIFLLGLALFLSCLNVFFRDTQVIMEVLLTAWFFLTPIFYRLGDIADERLGRIVRWLNPMASLVDFYRDIFYLGGMPGWDAIVRTLVTAILVLLVGYLFFLRLSPRFGEEI